MPEDGSVTGSCVPPAERIDTETSGTLATHAAPSRQSPAAAHSRLWSLAQRELVCSRWSGTPAVSLLLNTAPSSARSRQRAPALTSARSACAAAMRTLSAHSARPPKTPAPLALTSSGG